MVPVGREVSNPLPLLNSARFEQLLDDLAQQVDYVIVDAPPVGTVIDGAQIAKSCDGTLIVVNYNAVRRQELIDVKEQLEQTECPILGTVLNMVEYDNYMSKNTTTSPIIPATSATIIHRIQASTKETARQRNDRLYRHSFSFCLRC